MGKLGGRRPGSGRKSKADEDRLKDMCLSAVGKVFKDENALFTKLAKLAKEAKSEKDQLTALTKLLEYAYGKPKETIDLNTPESIKIKLGKDVRDLAGLSPPGTKGDTEQ